MGAFYLSITRTFFLVKILTFILSTFTQSLNNLLLTHTASNCKYAHLEYFQLSFLSKLTTQTFE
jgi:hypothetical protein